MVIFGFAIGIRRIDAIIDRIEIVLGTRAMHEIDHANAPHQATFGPTVLPFHQIHLAGIAFILHAIIQDQIRIGRVGNEWLREFHSVRAVWRSRRR